VCISSLWSGNTLLRASVTIERHVPVSQLFYYAIFAILQAWFTMWQDLLHAIRMCRCCCSGRQASCTQTDPECHIFRDCNLLIYIDRCGVGWSEIISRLSESQKLHYVYVCIISTFSWSIPCNLISNYLTLFYYLNTSLTPVTMPYNSVLFWRVLLYATCLILISWGPCRY